MNLVEVISIVIPANNSDALDKSAKAETELLLFTGTIGGESEAFATGLSCIGHRSLNPTNVPGA